MQDDLISRKDALASIKNLYPDMPVVDIFRARRKWLEKYAPYFECENAIEQLPSVKPQEPQTGYWLHIDDVMSVFDDYMCGEVDEEGIETFLEMLRDKAEQCPQEPKTGHWIYDRTRDWDGECKYECSECGMGSDVNYDYCMRCGTKMIEPQESEDKE